MKTKSLSLKGDAVIAARKALGWTRGDLAAHSGLQYHEVTSVERGLRRVKEHELIAITKALGMVLDDAYDEAAERSAGTEHLLINNNAVRTPEFHGVAKGDDCKVKGIYGTFHFMYHHVDDKQEYVQVFGPVSGRNPLSALRSIDPARLRDRHGRKLHD